MTVRATWQRAWAAVAIVALGAVSWLALRPRSALDRLQDAVDDVLAGEIASGCADLASWRDDASDPDPAAGPAIRRARHGEEAVVACVEAAIEAAQAIADPAARERALLEVADPEAPLSANPDQAQRVLEGLGGAPERVRVHSIEAAGPLSLAGIRRVMASQIARFRACHARLTGPHRGKGDEPDGGKKTTGASPFTLRFMVAPDGRPQLPVRVDPADDPAAFRSKAAAEAHAELAGCAARAAAFLTFDAHPEPSTVTLVLRWVD